MSFRTGPESGKLSLNWLQCADVPQCGAGDGTELVISTDPMSIPSGRRCNQSHTPRTRSPSSISVDCRDSRFWDDTTCHGTLPDALHTTLRPILCWWLLLSSPKEPLPALGPRIPRQDFVFVPHNPYIPLHPFWMLDRWKLFRRSWK